MGSCFQATETTQFWRCQHWRTAFRSTKIKNESSCQITKEPQGIKQVLLKQVLGKEKNSRQTLTQKHIVFIPTNSFHRRMTQTQAICKHNVYANTASTSETSTTRKYDGYEHADISICSVTKIQNNKSCRILEAIISPNCYHRWIFKIRETHETKQHSFKTKNKNNLKYLPCLQGPFFQVFYLVF